MNFQCLLMFTSIPYHSEKNSAVVEVFTWTFSVTLHWANEEEGQTLCHVGCNTDPQDGCKGGVSVPAQRRVGMRLSFHCTNGVVRMED